MKTYTLSGQARVGPDFNRVAHEMFKAFPDAGPFQFQAQTVNESVPCAALLGGSWVVRSGVKSPRIWAIAIVILLITPLRTPHEPPSN